MGFPGGSEVKASACNAGDLGSIPGSGSSLEKEMATHSSILAWRIPWMEEPGGLQSMGLQRVRNDWATSLSLSHHRYPTCMVKFIQVEVRKLQAISDFYFPLICFSYNFFSPQHSWSLNEKAASWGEIFK